MKWNSLDQGVFGNQGFKDRQSIVLSPESPSARQFEGIDCPAPGRPNFVELHLSG
jgi:hypothetical protein